MYASHNSLTGYKPKRWWRWIFLPFARCQRATIWQQMENGARVFDLRVRFDRHGGLVPCHGLVEFKSDVQAATDRLEASGCYYRVVLENRLGARRVKAGDLDRLKAMFLTPEHPHCLYVSDKRDWNTTFNPHGPERLKEKNLHGGAGCVIPRLWLWRYRRDRYRHSLNLKCDADTVYWYDFV